MLNQSFTTDNFNNIYDIANRKNSIVEYLGEEYKEILAQIKSLQNDISQIKRKKFTDRTDDENQTLVENKQKIDLLIANKKEIQLKELDKISKKINNKNFKFDLQAKDNDIFVIQDTSEAFFAIKQLQYNVRKTFKVKQSSRHLILSQIKLLLNDSSPKYVIRTDITKFFESVPQDKLLNKINENTLLSAQSKRFIEQILEDYNNKKDKTRIDPKRGIPRGVGVSSYLSELYMKDIDNQIKNMEDVVYYARYVDDIFIIISPNLPKKNIDSYYLKIKEIVGRECLILHEDGDKHNLIDLSSKVYRSTHYNFTYLGYKIHTEQYLNEYNITILKTSFGLSEDKKHKIERRVLKSIDYFNNKSKYDLKLARKNLLLCLHFLTTNTKLNGAKNKIKTGIYYSNDLLDSCFKKDINTLDNKLKGNWLSKIQPFTGLFANSVKKREYTDCCKKNIIARCSFSKGFNEKTYHTFSNDELRTIKSILQ
jgi:hypothetical protein